MQRRRNLFPVFFIFFIISLLLLIFSTTFKGVTGFFELAMIPVQRSTLGLFQSFGSKGVTSTLAKLQEENNTLIGELAKEKELEKENQALRDQFHTDKPSPQTLLPAHVIGMASFVPGDTSLDEIVIDKGKKDGLHVGSVLVYKNNVLGKIARAASYMSTVALITHAGSIFTAQTLKTSVLGIINNTGGGDIVFTNVVLSDKLEKGDIVVTKGDIDKNGNGYPPNLVVGKITSVNKKASALFQAAEVQSLVDFTKLHTVFVITN